MDVVIDATLDREDLLSRVMNDKDLLQQIVVLFDSQLTTQLEKIEQAIQLHDARQLQTDAHALKGAIGNFTTKAAFQAAFKLETMGREETITDAEPAYVLLKTETARLQTALTLLLAEL